MNESKNDCLLKTKNAHERDALIEFHEAAHEYYVKNPKTKSKQKMNVSVTTFVHKFFPSFNADKIIDNMMRSKKWENSVYYGMSKQEIKDQWEINRNESATLGTQMHKMIETFYNEPNETKIYEDIIEFQMFMKYYNDYSTLNPYRTEWEIYDEENNIAGSVDMLYENEDGTLDICDWKRSKKIEKDNDWESGKFPVSHLPNTNFWHYSLQLNVYKYILENKYNKKIKNMFLVCIHPNNESYIKYDVQDLQNEVADMFYPF